MPKLGEAKRSTAKQPITRTHKYTPRAMHLHVASKCAWNEKKVVIYPTSWDSWPSSPIRQIQIKTLTCVCVQYFVCNKLSCNKLHVY